MIMENECIGCILSPCSLSNFYCELSNIDENGEPLEALASPGEAPFSVSSVRLAKP